MVSAVVPCYNEERFIRPCLESILRSDYPRDRLEVLVVDGMSTDGTRATLAELAAANPLLRLLDNPDRRISIAMNLGIRRAVGSIVIKMDAHSTYARDYIGKCVRFLDEFRADNVGGILVAVPQARTFFSDAIAAASQTAFGVGNAYFRIGSLEPRWVDTAAFGCYRRDTLNSIGLYNEKLERGEDVELNRRLSRAGGRILLHPEIVAHYRIRADLLPFLVQRFRDGYWATFALRHATGIPVSLRHGVPLLVVVAGLGLAAGSFFSPWARAVLGVLALAYVTADVGVSIWTARARRVAGLALRLPIVFPAVHAAYGGGSLLGLLRVPWCKDFWVRRARRPGTLPGASS